VGVIPQTAAPIDILTAMTQIGERGEGSKYSWYETLKRIYRQNAANDTVFVERFVEKCQQLHLRTRVLYHDDAESRNLLRETQFSDLLVLSAAQFIPDSRLTAPPRQQLQLLRGAGCPILIVPAKYERIENYLLVYEGTSSCMRTIKQFSALLTDAARKFKILLAVVGDKSRQHAEEVRLLQEFADSHFPKLSILPLLDNAEEEILYNAREEEGVLLVCGSETHTLASLLIHNSKLRRFEFPVFVGR